MALAICSRIARTGNSNPAISTMVSRRDSASRGEFACTVVSEPSWPVFMAWSMSSASAPRTSPTTIRSGRMRNALRTRSRILTSPRPSAFAGRDSRLTTCGCCSWSSAASSIVRMRSRSGMNDESTFSNVVLPVPVPPEISTLSLPRTAASNTWTNSSENVPKLTKSLAVNGSSANFRIVSTEPRSASGGMIAFTREPFGRRASTIGDDSSTRRPTADTILSMTWRYCSSSANARSVFSSSPLRSMKISSCPLHMISVIVASARGASSGP